MHYTGKNMSDGLMAHSTPMSWRRSVTCPKLSLCSLYVHVFLYLQTSFVMQ